MVKREIKKTLMRFLRNEVTEKAADWGELRRVNSQVIVKRGLPNIPNLVIKTDAGLSFLTIVVWRKELRLYLFDSFGSMLYGQSYYDDLDEVYNDLKSKSKKIARFPPLKKSISQAQRDSQIDKQFKGVWNHLAKIFQISQRYRKNRPLIKESYTTEGGIYGTKVIEEFIFVPHKTNRLGTIFTFYSLFFFLPLNIRQNIIIGEAIAFRLLKSIKKFQNEKLDPDWPSLRIYKDLDAWQKKSPINLLKALDKLSEYYDPTWKTTDFLELINSKLDLVENTSRKRISKLYCELFSKTQNLDFLILSGFLGLPFGFDCTIPTKYAGNESISILVDLKTWRISNVLNYLNQKQESITRGLLKAIKEALNYQFGSIIKIEMDLVDRNRVILKNRSDLPIFLTSAVQVFPDGTEHASSFQETMILPSKNLPLDLRILGRIDNTPIKFEYCVKKTSNRISKLFFKGTIVI
ncbi:MAG: hypothetical protein ACFFAU_05260 [Candidatus Hodarchaeota archaeon]